MAATTTTHTTACPLDCPDTCSLSVTVDAGRITAVDAAPGNPFTDGFICQKVKHHAERVHGDERVLTPLVRTGAKGSGEFRSVSWDEALDLFVAKLRQAIAEHGAESIVPYQYNSSAASLQSVLTERLFRRLGATEVDHTICALTHYLAYLCTYPGLASADPSDLVHSKLIVLWGANPTVTNTHLLPLLTKAQREHGARLVVVDPRRTGVAKRADLWVPVRPGTDVVLAFAVARELEANDWIDRAFVDVHTEGADAFLDAAREWTLERAADVCGVDADIIHTMAHDFATIRPAMLRPGWGLERTRNGGSACAAVMALPALTGQFAVPGSGVLVSLSEAAPVSGGGPRTAEERHQPRPRHLNMNELGARLVDEAYDPPISVLFVQGANPVVMNPNQNAVLAGLARDDLFTVVHEQVMTDTARWADLVLPAATHFEYDDLAASYGSYTLQPVRKVIDAVGESVNNSRLAVMLAERLGFARDRFPDDASLISASISDGGDPGATRVLHEPGTVVQFRDCFPAEGKAQLANLGPLGVPRYAELVEEYPLTLISPASPKMINSMFGEFNQPDPSVRVHPDDAAARGLCDGAIVRVHNGGGAVVAALKIDTDLRPGVVVMTKGVWLRDTRGGSGVNALVPDTFSDLGDGACFNDARVEVSAQ